MLVVNKYFYKNKKSKLYFGNRVVVLNNFIYQTIGSRNHHQYTPSWDCPHLYKVHFRLAQKPREALSLLILSWEKTTTVYC
jgi:hypothetical protein